MDFKRWLAEGEMVVYHGSKTPITAFDSKKHLSGYYPGFYTTPDTGLLKNFGDIVYSMRIDPEKFYWLDSKSADELKHKARAAGFSVSGGSGSGEARYLASLGYHGIRRGSEYILFDPSVSASSFAPIEGAIEPT